MQRLKGSLIPCGPITQLFQRFFPNTDIATYGLNQSRGQIIGNAYHGGKVWRYHYNFFPARKGWTGDQLSIGRHPNNDLK